MITSKNKAIDKLNEKAAPKKGVTKTDNVENKPPTKPKGGKKPTKQAEVSSEASGETSTPESEKAASTIILASQTPAVIKIQQVLGDSTGTLPDASQHGNAVAPATNNTVTEQPEPAHEDLPHKAADIWGAIKSHWLVWALGAAVLVVGLAWVLATIQNHKAAKEAQQAQRTQQKIKVDKDSLAQTEANLNAILIKKNDTALIEINRLGVEAAEYQTAWKNRMIKINQILEKQKNELQNRIANASDDSLRAIGSQ